MMNSKSNDILRQKKRLKKNLNSVNPTVLFADTIFGLNTPRDINAHDVNLLLTNQNNK